VFRFETKYHIINALAKIRMALVSSVWRWLQHTLYVFGQLRQGLSRRYRVLDDLEAIMHPPIRETLKRAIARSRSPLVLVEAALLQENGADGLCDAVVYVAAPARVRRARALSRHGWTEREHRAREAGQWPLRRKRARADIVVDNGGPVERTRRSVRAALRRIDRLRKG